MIFTNIIEDLNFNFNKNRTFFEKLSRINPNLAYSKINEIAEFVGSRYGLDLKLHFPDPKKISVVESYGKENIGIVVDRYKKKFSIPREEIKIKATETIVGASVSDAYMYEGKEGLRVSFKNGRIELMPGSIHIWCTVTEDVEKFANWLFSKVLIKP